MRPLLASPLLALVVACSDQSVGKFNTPPEASINAPGDGDTVREGASVTLRGAASDANHAVEDLVTRWFVDDTEACAAAAPEADGVTTCAVVIGAGTSMALRLEVSDPAGASATARADVVIVPDATPEVVVVAPEAGDVLFADELITLRGTVADAEDASETLTTWWADAGAPIAGTEGAPTSSGEVLAYAQLGEGVHPLELHARDSAGNEGIATVRVEVRPPNHAPTCLLTTPEADLSVELGRSVAFAGVVADEDEPAGALSVTWESDLDGVLGGSVPSGDGAVGFSTSALSVGVHRVALHVTDGGGATCEAARIVTVQETPRGSGSVTFEENGIPFVTVYAGTFNMGCTAAQAATGACQGDELPAHEVTLTHDFYISQFEITRLQYTDLMSDDPSRSSCGYDCPLDWADWGRAAELANLLSYGYGYERCYDCSGGACVAAMNPYECDGYRLPTEAEWEAAARCGRDLVYAGSDDPAAVGWMQPWGMEMHRGGELLPNACALYDMSGNMWEYVHDDYSATAYEAAGRVDPYVHGGPGKVMRGGSFALPEHLARVSTRSWVTYGSAGMNFGFRLARTAR